MDKREDIKQKLFEIMDNNLIDTEIELNENVSYKEDLGLDSMSFIRIVLEINDIFNIEIQSHEITPQNFLNIQNTIDFLQRKI